MAQSKRQKDSQPALPTLNEDTLSALTSKIESRLKQPKSATKSAKASPRPTNANVKAPAPDEVRRGKKRGLDGEILQGGSRTKKPGTRDDLEALRAEVIALGGTEEDLALIDGLESDSEVENDTKSGSAGGSVKKDDHLRDDVAKMVKDMGIASSMPTATVTDSEADVESEEEIEEHEDETEDADDNAPDLSNGLSHKSSMDKKSSSKFAVTPQAEWFNIPLPEIPTKESSKKKIQTQVVDAIHSYAKELLEAENAAYQVNQKSASSSQKFYATVINSGTLTDKISALTLAVQESPLHNVKGLESLLGLSKKRSRAQAIDVLRALKDLCAQGSLLPSDRRLRTFSTQPGLLSALDGVSSWSSSQPLPKGLRQQHLIVWAFEHWIKDVYFEILKILETWCNDELEYSKTRALSFVFELLKEKPEQESNLLRLLVNKLGDRTKKIASRASYLLLQLQTAHPLMKGTIISAIESDLLFKPGQTLHAKYYGVITLNQTILSPKEEDLANKLLDIYFGMFVVLLKPEYQAKSHAKSTDTASNKPSLKTQSGKVSVPDDELREKLVSAILTGINRAYPYVLGEREKVAKHMDTLFRITHSANFNTSIQAMLLIQQLTISNQMSSDRFYRTLYESLLDPRLTTSSKQSLYLNLLFKALKADLNVKRVKAFVKRILQIVTLHQPSFVVGVFHLLKELEVTFPSIEALVGQAEEHDLEEEHFRDVEDGEPAEGDSVPGTTENSQLYYDGKKRDPEHSNADRSCLWELLPYLAHYHPSVNVGAESILTHAPLSGKPDLNLYTLIHFLDRFVYRNPKADASSNVRGVSIMQPTLAGDKSMSLFSTTAKQQTSVNNESFWKQKAGEVAPEDAFFHQYFSSIGKDRLAKKQAKKGEEDEENEEDAIWKAITESRPEVEGDDESDDDLDMDDLKSDFDGSDGEMLDDMEDEDEDMDSSDSEMDGEEDTGVEFVGFGGEDSNEYEVDDDEDDLDAIFQAESNASQKSSKKPATTSNKARERKKKLKSLPVFASADDYAAMLEDTRGEDMG